MRYSDKLASLRFCVSQTSLQALVQAFIGSNLTHLELIDVFVFFDEPQCSCLDIVGQRTIVVGGKILKAFVHLIVESQRYCFRHAILIVCSHRIQTNTKEYISAMRMFQRNLSTGIVANL